MKLKFKDVTAARTQFCSTKVWLKSKKKKDHKCQNCGKGYSEEGFVSLLAVEGSINKHSCTECAEAYIENGAKDIFKAQSEYKDNREKLISAIKELGYRESYYSKELNDYKIDELEKLHNKLLEEKKKQDLIDLIVISEEDSKIDQYLITDYGVLQDTKYLKCTEQIEPYFKDVAYEYLECGQGFYQDSVQLKAKIADKYYEVNATAEIGSSKQDRGDRLYWVEEIESVTWEEIQKPEPKAKDDICYMALKVTDAQKIDIENFFKENGIKIL